MTYGRSTLGLLAAWAAVAVLQGETITGAAEVVIRGVSIVDVMTGRVEPDRDLVIRGTRIAAIGPARAEAEPAKTTVLGAGKFVMPGLIDAAAPAADFADARLAQPLLSWGVTALGDVAPSVARRTRWQQDLHAGRVYAPRLTAACDGRLAVAATTTSRAPDAVHDALQRAVAAGRSPARALRTFTHDNARALCLDGLGAIAVGQPADLLVLRGNPLDDIRQTRALDAVVFRGEVLTQAHLQLLRRAALVPPTPPAR